MRLRIGRLWQARPARGAQHYCKLERDVSVLFRGVGVALVLEESEGADQFGPSLRRLDDLVYEAALGRDEGVGELLLELGDAGAARRLLVRGLCDLAPVENAYGPFGAHHGDLRGRPGEVHVRAYVLR